MFGIVLALASAALAVQSFADVPTQQPTLQPSKPPLLLVNLRVSHGVILEPPFSPAILSYKANVEGITNVTVTPYAPDTPPSNITINNVPVRSGNASQEIPLEEDDVTTIIIALTSNEETSVVDYNIQIFRLTPTPTPRPTGAPSVSPSFSPTQATAQPTSTPTRPAATPRPSLAPSTPPLRAHPQHCIASAEPGGGLEYTSVEGLAQFNLSAATVHNIPVAANFAFQLDGAEFAPHAVGPVGQYMVSYVAHVSSDFPQKSSLRIFLNDTASRTEDDKLPEILGSPFSVMIEPGPVDSSKCQVLLQSQAVLPVDGSPLMMRVLLLLRDKRLNNIWETQSPNIRCFLTLAGNTNLTFPTRTRFVKNGNWNVHSELTRPGTYLLQTDVDDMPLPPLRFTIQSAPESGPVLSQLSLILIGAGGVVVLGLICILLIRKSRASQKLSSEIYDPLVPPDDDDMLTSRRLLTEEVLYSPTGARQSISSNSASSAPQYYEDEDYDADEYYTT